MFQKEELKSAPGKFGHILKEIRQKNGYTREQFSERIGISTRYLSVIENEQREPSYDVLYRIFHGLGISADTIFYPNKSETDNSNAEQIKRLYLECSERDKKIIKNSPGVLLEPGFHISRVEVHEALKGHVQISAGLVKLFALPGLCLPFGLEAPLLGLLALAVPVSVAIDCPPGVGLFFLVNCHD